MKLSKGETSLSFDKAGISCFIPDLPEGMCAKCSLTFKWEG